MSKFNQIFYVQTYDYSINIGRGYNEHIKHLPDDCWICVNDSDSLYLNPKFGHQLNDIINEHGDEFALLGCVTNRLGGIHQLYEEKFSNDLDVRHHYGVALKLAKDHYSEVVETSGVAGLLMLFKKSTWEKVGGFQENNIACDTAFNNSVRAAKIGKIGLMKGVYLFHTYRIWQNDRLMARHDTKHLQK